MNHQNRQMTIIKWGIGLLFLLIALVIYVVMKNLGLIIIFVLGYVAYKKFPMLKNKLQPIAKRIQHHIKERRSK